MRSFASLLVLASSVGVAVAQTALEIFTPPQPPVQCQPTLITWQGGVPPYIVSVIDNSVDPTTPIVTFTGLTNTSITWVDTAPPGDILLFTIKDSTGAPQNSSPMTVPPGGSNSCLTPSSGLTGPSGSSGVIVSKSTSAPVSTSHTTSAPLSVPPTSTASTSVPVSSTKPPSSSVAPSSTGSASGSASSTAPTNAAAHQDVPAAAFVAALGAVFAFLL
ncbi:hypothetical protein B0H12DRAFT_1100696 [Mycena haematopus]|nr:hypothetical protein B0H12DRAFT_1100696 [Mycena haematopus]